MQIDILTLFPRMFEGPLDESMLKIAREKGILTVNVHNLRDWTTDRHKTADDKPFGGGAGMVMKIEPIYKALKDLSKKKFKSSAVILLSPQGAVYNQKTAKKLSLYDRLILICGHYEGVDARVSVLADMEISCGDYILTGGELPACIIIDSVARLLPDVLGEAESLNTESFENGLLEYPQFTRPREFEGMKVPEVLFSGDHKKIEAWRYKQSLKKTKTLRPDLYKTAMPDVKGGVNG